MYGLIGRSLGGSLSARIFAEWGFDYRNFELSSIEELPALLSSEPSLSGFNVTAPYKIEVLKYLDSIDPVAEAVGAVNCVVREGDYLKGYNTDALALREIFGETTVPPNVIQSDGCGAIILGTGGAARAARWALAQHGIEATMVSRGGGITYSDLTPSVIADHTLIINATPAGEPSIPYDALTPAHTLFDMTYNPAETPFLRHGREAGAHTINGLGMLHRQAELSCFYFRK